MTQGSHSPFSVQSTAVGASPHRKVPRRTDRISAVRVLQRRLQQDGQLDAYLLRYGFHHRAALLSRGSKEKPGLPRSHPSPRQKQPERIGAATAASAGGLRVPAEAGLVLAGRRGAGVQPGSSACDGAPVFETGLVQDAAAETDHPRGGLRQPHHHQPLLLRTVQLLLHPQAHPPGGGSLPVLLVLQTQAFYHHDFHFELSGPAAAHQEEAHPARQTVPLHIHRPGLKHTLRGGVRVGARVFVSYAYLRGQDCWYRKNRGCHTAKSTCRSPSGDLLHIYFKAAYTYHESLLAQRVNNMEQLVNRR